ncbi:LysR family transcriptional regulator [Komagataeibacter rhaeticus]|uniref:LysR family transcriptional regulator n=1 Tax=Komagataeibacter rhaeticus TaxID=215221 RepID=UPI001A5F633D|nr:LysR family transcriptional regulator [Komagataeibacter rhaeticus]MBL7240246.1 LysR family transcriptional regulator [Komagataeibacter rhaeticus]
MKHIHSLSIRDLQILLILGTTRSLGRTAIELGTSVAALSRRLTKIEDALGITLFERSVSGTLVTHSGRQVLHLARRIIAEAHNLLAFGTNTANVHEGEIRLGLACPPLHPKVEEWLRLWNESHSRIPIGLYAPQGDSMIELLLNRDVDVAIFHPDVLRTNLASIPLYRENIVAVLPENHQLAEQQSVRLAELRAERMLVPFLSSDDRCARFQLGLLGPQAHITIHRGGTLTLLSQVRAGAGFALCNTAIRDLRPPGLAFRNIDDIQAEFEMHLAWRADAEDALLGRFVRFMQTVSRTGLPLSSARSADAENPDPPA